MTKARSNATAPAAKGELVIGTGTDTSGVLSVGNNGETLVADSSASTGLRWQGNYAAGKNYVINGNMNIAQRGTSTAGVTSSGYLVDRLLLQMTTMGTLTLSQETDAPSGFGNSAKVLVTTADAAPDANDRVRIIYRNEGQSMQGLQYGSANAKTVTVSFWVKSNVTGTFILEMVASDGTQNRSISATYTISASGTWEKKTLTFAGDTGQVITNSNLLGWELSFWLGAGTNFTSGALNTTWNNLTNANRAGGQVNAIANTNNYWQITGLQAEIGSVATDFQLSSGTLAGELAACQRYLPAIPLASGQSAYMGYAYATNGIVYSIPFPTQARVSPTGITIPALSNFAATNSANTAITPTALTFDSANLNSATVLATATVTAGTPNRLTFYANAAYMLFTGCEL